MDPAVDCYSNGLFEIDRIRIAKAVPDRPIGEAQQAEPNGEEQSGQGLKARRNRQNHALSERSDYTRFSSTNNTTNESNHHC